MRERIEMRRRGERARRDTEERQKRHGGKTERHGGKSEKRHGGKTEETRRKEREETRRKDTAKKANLAPLANHTRLASAEIRIHLFSLVQSTRVKRDDTDTQTDIRRTDEEIY